MKVLNRIVLGTAQFGFNYGVVNHSGQVYSGTASDILNAAKLLGIDTLDTAISYGESEKVLGIIGVLEFKVISKLPYLSGGSKNLQELIINEVEKSLSRLNVQSLYALLLHDSAMWKGELGYQIRSCLMKLKSLGKIKKIGISIYSPSELECINFIKDIDIIQAPFNLIDRRLVKSGWLNKLHSMGIEVHVRSVFLQGLLLQPMSDIPDKFMQWKSMWQKWHNWLIENKEISPLNACMTFVKSFAKIDKIIVGVLTVKQLHEIVNAYEYNFNSNWPDIESDDVRLIHPYNWENL